VAPGTGSYTATGLSNGTAYTFTVVAVDATGNVSAGVEATATPQAPDLNAPGEVTRLVATPSDGEIALSWNDPSDSDLDRVEITWSPGGTTAQTVSAGAEGYTATGLENGSSYTFTLRAVDDEGNLSAGVTITAETPFTGNLLTGLQQLGVEFRDYDRDSGWAVVVNIVGDQPDIGSLMPAPDPNLGTRNDIRFVTFVIRDSGLTQELPTGTFPVAPASDAPGNAFSANFFLGLSLDFANDDYLGSDHDGSTPQQPFWTGQSWDYEIEGGQVEISPSGSNYTIDFSFDLDTGNSVTGSFTGPVDLSIEAEPPDLTPPDAPTISGVSNGTVTRNNVTFSVGNIESGASVEYSVSGGSSWSTYSGPVTLSSHGAYQITARQTDAAGNTSDNAIMVNVTIDKEGPDAVSGLAASGGYRAVTLEWTDPPSADLNSVEIAWAPADGGGSVTVPADAEAVTVSGLEGDRSYTFSVRTVDELGNRGAVRQADETTLHPLFSLYPGIDLFPLGDDAEPSMTPEADQFFDAHREALDHLDILPLALRNWNPDDPVEEYTLNDGGVTWYGRRSSIEFDENGALSRSCWRIYDSPVEGNARVWYQACISIETSQDGSSWGVEIRNDPDATDPVLSGGFSPDSPNGFLGLYSEQSTGLYLFTWGPPQEDNGWAWSAVVYRQLEPGSGTIDEFLTLLLSADGNDGEWGHSLLSANPPANSEGTW
jgi:chitodextrinase